MCSNNKFLKRLDLLICLGISLCSCSTTMQVRRTAPFYKDILGTYILKGSSETQVLQFNAIGPKLDSIISRYVWLIKPHAIGNFVLINLGRVPYKYSAGLFMFIDPPPPSFGDDVAIPPQDIASVFLFDLKDSILSKSGYFLTGFAKYDTLGNIVLDLGSSTEKSIYIKLE